MTVEKSYEEIEREYAEIRKQGKEFEGLVPVKARVSKNPSVIWSLRLKPGDLTEIERAARARGITISHFIRRAALGAVVEGEQLAAGEKAAALAEVRERLRELSEAMSRL